jgi:hypothetical protein
MYLPALKTAIQHLEEKHFYGVALMYLTQLGYRELSVVDGPGDGGRDVTCSREDLRIQLSVRKDWERKINEEASNTANAGFHHLIFVTNRIINPQAEQTFLQSKYNQKGNVDISIHDLRRISTALSQPGVIRQAYEMLGMAVPLTITATPKEIALSTVLLFSQEAKELRDEVLQASVRAQLLKDVGISEIALVQKVVQAMPGVNVERAAKAALTRLRTAGRVLGNSIELRLSQAEQATMEAAETEFLVAVDADVNSLIALTGLSSEDTRKLLALALELLVRNREFDGSGPAEEALRNFMAEHGLSRSRVKIYEALAGTSSARLKQYGATIDQIFSTNSFDIYRALGQRTDISMVLDSSVAMPVIFGLEFGAAKSRYGIAALALRDACKAHNIRLVVPRCYLNEMASHGRKALEWLEVFKTLPEEARTSLRASGNAYLSHYTHISEIMRESGDELSLETFLKHFGIVAGYSIERMENKISSILEQHDITIIPDGRFDQDIRNRIVEEKPFEFRVLVEHDAIVCTMLKNDTKQGFIFATWDKVIIDIVEDIARVLADTPARVIDFLSMAAGQSFESEQSFELLSTLLHSDEKIAQKLAEKVEKIRSVEQAYKFRAFIDEARLRGGSTWTLKPEDVAPFLDDHVQAPRD